MVYISPLRINLKQSLFLASNAALCNKRKSVTKVSSLVHTYSISKTVGIFTDNKDSITCRFHCVNEENINILSLGWFQESYLLDKTLFVHNIDAEILKALSMQVEVSSNKYHLLWGSVISFHMERIHIKLTRYQRKIDNIFHKINIQFNLTGTTKLYLCYLRIEIQTVSYFDYYFPSIINFPSILASKVCCLLPIKAWKFSGHLSDDEHVSVRRLKF